MDINKLRNKYRIVCYDTGKYNKHMNEEVFSYLEYLQEENAKLKKAIEGVREDMMPLITLEPIERCNKCGSKDIKLNYKPYMYAENALIKIKGIY